MERSYDNLLFRRIFLHVVLHDTRFGKKIRLETTRRRGESFTSSSSIYSDPVSLSRGGASSTEFLLVL